MEVNFVGADVAQGGHGELRIEGDGDFRTLVVDGESFTSFTDVRGGGDDFDAARGEDEFDGIGFVAGEEGDAGDGLEEAFALKGDAFFGFAGDDLTVVRIVAVDEFADEQGVSEIEGDLAVADADGDFALIAEEAGEFVDGLGGDDDVDVLALRELDFLFDHSEAATVGGDHGEVVVFEGEEDAVEDVAGFVR